MAAPAITLATLLARFDSAPHTPPRYMAAWLRTTPSIRWAALDVLAAADAATTICRLDALMAAVNDTERAVGDWSQEWRGPEDAEPVGGLTGDAGWLDDADAGAPFTEARP